MSSFADFLIVEPPVAGLQRLRAGFSGHAYDRHRRVTYAVGITEAGSNVSIIVAKRRRVRPGRSSSLAQTRVLPWLPLAAIVATLLANSISRPGASRPVLPRGTSTAIRGRR